MYYLFKVDIEIDFTVIFSFIAGIVLGAILMCMLYALFVLASLRNKKFLIKSEEDSLTVNEVKDMIINAQHKYKDKDERGKISKAAHCKNICTNLAVDIASKFYPDSKYPLLELSIDESLMLTLYIEKRIEEVLNRRGIRLLKKLRVSSIVSFTQKTNKVMDSKAYKYGKNANSVLTKIKKVVNLVNPAWWFKRLVIDKTISVVTNKICLVVIAIVGEETYKIYSKTVFNKIVDIESNVDELIESIDKDFIDATKELNEGYIEENNSPQYKFKTRGLRPTNGIVYNRLYSNAFKLKEIGQKNSIAFIKFRVNRE
ncbi:MAG: hypothetical protein IJY14_01695 [Acholeplasmatales bacterium]|nr:hypothetical protein [Acholeplasmatales bacterium]